MSAYFIQQLVLVIVVVGVILLWRYKRARQMPVGQMV